MKTSCLFVGLVLLCCTSLAGSLPVITVQPTNQLVAPGGTATFSVTTTGATGCQWRFDGTNLAGATASTLQIPGAQTSNAGYYMAVVKNETGWVPSQMAYLAVAASPGGWLALSNRTAFASNTSAQACYGGSLYGQGITNGSAQIVAGPALDQMQPCGQPTSVSNGYFRSPLTQYVPTVAPGQTVYYRVVVSYTNEGWAYTQPSTVLKLIAGSDTASIPSTAGLKFPTWPEWPEPWLFAGYSSPTCQVRIPGESLTLSNYFVAYGDFGLPTIQWRKDGNPLGAPINFEGPSDYTFYSYNRVLHLTNLQPTDAGIYDAVVIGNNWLVGPKITMSIQLTNGPGVLCSPRMTTNGFVSDLEGVAGRNYGIQWSTNLSSWNDLTTVSNATGLVTFTNSATGDRFYRAVLQP